MVSIAVIYQEPSNGNKLKSYGESYTELDKYFVSINLCIFKIHFQLIEKEVVKTSTYFR